MFRASLPVFASLAVVLAAAASNAAGQEPHMKRSTDLPRPRDGDVAIRQELEATRRVGTRDAYDLFIVRHPAHPLAELARRERADLSRRRPE